MTVDEIYDAFEDLQKKGKIKIHGIKVIQDNPRSKPRNINNSPVSTIIYSLPNNEMNYGCVVTDLLNYKGKIPELKQMITKEIDNGPIKHMSRIVGYFSTTNNWNKSKLAELKDRGHGNYGIIESPTIPERKEEEVVTPTLPAKQ